MSGTLFSVHDTVVSSEGEKELLRIWCYDLLHTIAGLLPLPEWNWREVTGLEAETLVRKRFSLKTQQTCCSLDVGCIRVPPPPARFVHIRPQRPSLLT